MRHKKHKTHNLTLAISPPRNPHLEIRNPHFAIRNSLLS